MPQADRPAPPSADLEPGRATRPDGTGRRAAAAPTDVLAQLQRRAGNAAVTLLLPRARLQRAPADFATSSVLTHKAGWGFLGIMATPWDALQQAVRAYAALPPDRLAARHAALDRIPALITAWEVHHRVGVKPQLDADETAKVSALVALRALIARELRELSGSGADAMVDEADQGIRSIRFQGDFLLEEVYRGRAELVLGDRGLPVTKIQQGLADLGHLAPDKVTGTFDADTATGVRVFQQASGKAGSGRLDSATMRLLVTAFTGYGAERRLATAPAVAPKAAPGEFAHGTAPAALTARARDLGAGDQAAATKAVSTAQVAAVGGVLPTFTDDIGRGPYRARLKAAVLARADLEYDALARGKATKRGPGDLYGWPQIEAVAVEAKAATDAVFGKYAVGPPLAHGAGLHDAWDAKVLTLSAGTAEEDKAATWRVDKILTGNDEVKAIDAEHGAIQSRGPEKAIVDAVRSEVVASRRDQLIETHKAWPAFSGGGEVYLQRFVAGNRAENRTAMWDLFQTVVHEYLHTLEHSRHRTYRGGLGQQQGDFALREGVTEYLTHIALSGVTYGDALRATVEGGYHDVGVKHPVPAYHGYGERRNAEKLAGLVGTTNVMAAFFLGEVERIGGTV